jgi:hypothetical protein
MDAAATDLPDTHNPMAPSTVPDSVNLDDARISIVLQLKASVA